MEIKLKDRIKQLRKERKMTQAQLGKELGYGYTAIANYESGRNQPSIADLKKLSSVFHVSLDYLIGVSDIRKPDVLKGKQWKQLCYYLSQLNKQSIKMLLLYAQWLMEKEGKTVSEEWK